MGAIPQYRKNEGKNAIVSLASTLQVPKRKVEIPLTFETLRSRIMTPEMTSEEKGGGRRRAFCSGDWKGAGPRTGNWRERGAEEDLSANSLQTHRKEGKPWRGGRWFPRY